jgi:cell division protein FtsQ
MRRFTRRSRRRRAGWLTAAGLLVVLVLLIVAAVYSPLLALRTITVDGTQRLSAATLEKALAPQLGTPLALLDEGAIKRELGRFDLIRSYVTELQPPDTLVVHISERTPVGVIQGADDFQLVDPAGVIVDRSAKRPDGVPLIQLGDAPLHGPGFASMAEVLLALPADVRGQVDTVAALTHDDVTLTLRGSGQRVVWGSADRSALKAQVLARLIALHGQSGSGTYTVSAPQFAVFNPGDPTAVGGTDGGASTPSPNPTSTPHPSSTPDAGDQGGVQQ